MADLRYPVWMTERPELKALYRQTWEDTGDVQIALDEVRQSDAYAEAFPGNVRADGTVRYDENTYLSVVDSYENALLAIDVNPDLFNEKWGDLIAGDVSPSEFTNRIESMYERVIDTAPQVAQYYADNYDTDMTTSAIVASVLDPDIGQQIINKRIAVSEVGGMASQRNFTIAKDFANQLVNAGMDTSSEAAQFFSLAEGLLPTLQVLTNRHMDPDDDFTLEEFAAAEVFQRADMRRNVRQLLEAERSQFLQRGGQGNFGRDPMTGSVEGLVDR